MLINHLSGIVAVFLRACNSLIISFYSIPVNYIKKHFHIISTEILVFQIISMLPDIDGKDRDITGSLADRIVLIR